MGAKKSPTGHSCRGGGVKKGGSVDELYWSDTEAERHKNRQICGQTCYLNV
jgi:hypothetical protein